MVAELAPLGQLNFTGIGVYTDSTRGPNWLIAGLEDYARSAYRAAPGVGTSPTPGGGTPEWPATPATRCETWRRVATGRSRRWATSPSIGLVERAGEPAVFEYYRLLPPLPSVDAAFEQAFGLTLEDFYEQFEAYRATLRQ